MQTDPTETPQIFPRLATYLEYDQPIPLAAHIPEGPVIQEASFARLREYCHDQPTSFDAIADAYANDPDRWDGLE
jgi:hypothetical protein